MSDSDPAVPPGLVRVNLPPAPDGLVLVGLLCDDCGRITDTDGRKTGLIGVDYGACGVDYGPDRHSHLNVRPVYAPKRGAA